MSNRPRISLKDLVVENNARLTRTTGKVGRLTQEQLNQKRLDFLKFRETARTTRDDVEEQVKLRKQFNTQFGSGFPIASAWFSNSITRPRSYDQQMNTRETPIHAWVLEELVAGTLRDDARFEGYKFNNPPTDDGRYRIEVTYFDDDDNLQTRTIQVTFPKFNKYADVLAFFKEDANADLYWVLKAGSDGAIPAESIRIFPILKWTAGKKPQLNKLLEGPTHCFFSPIIRYYDKIVQNGVGRGNKPLAESTIKNYQSRINKCNKYMEEFKTGISKDEIEDVAKSLKCKVIINDVQGNLIFKNTKNEKGSAENEFKFIYSDVNHLSAESCDTVIAFIEQIKERGYYDKDIDIVRTVAKTSNYLSDKERVVVTRDVLKGIEHFLQDNKIFYKFYTNRQRGVYKIQTNGLTIVLDKLDSEELYEDFMQSIDQYSISYTDDNPYYHLIQNSYVQKVQFAYKKMPETNHDLVDFDMTKAYCQSQNCSHYMQFPGYISHMANLKHVKEENTLEFVKKHIGFYNCTITDCPYKPKEKVKKEVKDQINDGCSSLARKLILSWGLSFDQFIETKPYLTLKKEDIEIILYVIGEKQFVSIENGISHTDLENKIKEIVKTETKCISDFLENRLTKLYPQLLREKLYEYLQVEDQIKDGYRRLGRKCILLLGLTFDEFVEQIPSLNFKKEEIEAILFIIGEKQFVIETKELSYTDLENKIKEIVKTKTKTISNCVDNRLKKIYLKFVESGAIEKHPLLVTLEERASELYKYKVELDEYKKKTKKIPVKQVKEKIVLTPLEKHLKAWNIKQNGVYYFTSPMLSFLSELGLKIQLNYGCWTPKPIDIEFSKEMRETRTPDSIPLYSYTIGTMAMESQTKRVNFYASKDFNEELSAYNGDEVSYVEYDDGSEIETGIYTFNIKKKDYEKRNHKHIAAYILSYTFINVMKEAMKYDLKHLYAVKVDSLLLHKDANPQENELFRLKTGTNGAALLNSPIFKYFKNHKCSIIPEDLKPNDMPIEEEFIIGQGGSGKSYHFCEDFEKINYKYMNLLYVCPTNKLKRSKIVQLETKFGKKFYACTVAKLLGGANFRSFSEECHEKFGVIFIDEATMISEETMLKIKRKYRDCKIYFAGDFSKIMSNIAYQAVLETEGVIPLSLFDKCARERPSFEFKNDMRSIPGDPLIELKVELRKCMDERNVVKAKALILKAIPTNRVKFESINSIYNDGDICISFHRDLINEQVNAILKDKAPLYRVKNSNVKLDIYRGDILKSNLDDEGKQIKDSYIELRRCFTAHSVQGETIEKPGKVFIMLDDLLEEKFGKMRLLYTAISRVRSISQLVLVTDIPAEVIQETITMEEAE